MLRKLRERMESEKGFTLVELLVVILIIGILAAIAIPSFLSQREKAQDAEAKSAVKTAQTAVESRFTDENTYAATPAQLVAVEATLADVEADLEVNGTATDYTVTVESSTGQTFSIARAAAGTTTRPCTAPGDGGCPTDGTW